MPTPLLSPECFHIRLPVKLATAVKGCADTPYIRDIDRAAHAFPIHFPVLYYPYPWLHGESAEITMYCTSGVKSTSVSLWMIAVASLCALCNYVPLVYSVVPLLCGILTAVYA